MTTLKTDETKLELSEQQQPAKKVFIDPEISAPIDVLEATAFFQPVTGGTDVVGDLN